MAMSVVLSLSSSCLPKYTTARLKQILGGLPTRAASTALSVPSCPPDMSPTMVGAPTGQVTGGGTEQARAPAVGRRGKEIAAVRGQIFAVTSCMGAMVPGMQEAADGTSVAMEFDRGGVTRVAQYGSIPADLGGVRSMKRSPGLGGWWGAGLPSIRDGGEGARTRRGRHENFHAGSWVL
jgi:hypothetical protein